MAQPKKIKARYHRLTLKTGHIVEIGWSIANRKYLLTYWHPRDHFKAGDGFDEDDEKYILGHSVREVFAKCRRAIIEEENPDIKAVRERVAPDKYSVSKMLEGIADLKRRMMEPTPPKVVYVSPVMAEVIERMTGQKDVVYGAKVKITSDVKSDEIITDKEVWGEDIL